MTNGDRRATSGKDLILAIGLYLSLVLTGAALGVSFVSKELSIDGEVSDFSTASASKLVSQCGEAVLYERNANDLFFISASINGKTVPMLVDTGATNSSLPYNLSYALNLSSTYDEVTYVPLETANGFVSAEIHHTQSLLLNGHQLSVDMLLLQNHSDSGILGMDVLSNFEMVFSGRALKLTSRCGR